MEFPYDSSAPFFTNAYLWPPLVRILSEEAPSAKRIFEVGCGNGSTAQMLVERGYAVEGVDTSESGIAVARKSFPQIPLHVGSVYDDLAGRYGTFPVVISLEVIEHCADPRGFMRTFRALLAAGGLGIIATPYHGYLKNLLIAASGKFDHHFDPLWDGGHLKFFSIPKLRQLFNETGFSETRFHRVGRLPQVAKSVIAVIRA